jgi:hypothetical protein
VAETFKGRARAAKPALVDGRPALAVIMGGQLRIVLRLTITGDRISAVEAVADAGGLAGSTWRCCSDNRRQAGLDPCRRPAVPSPNTEFRIPKWAAGMIPLDRSPT